MLEKSRPTMSLQHLHLSTPSGTVVLIGCTTFPWLYEYAEAWARGSLPGNVMPIIKTKL